MKTYNLLEKLLEKYPNFELGVNTVFCSENQDSMDRIIDFVSGLKNIKTHTISLIRGSLEDESYKKIDYKKYLHAIKRLEENLKNKTSGTYHFRGARIKAAQDILQRSLIHRTLLEQKADAVLCRQAEPCPYRKRRCVSMRNTDGKIGECEGLRI